MQAEKQGGEEYYPNSVEEAPKPNADELDMANDGHEQVLERIREADENMEKTGTATFALYKNLLDETALLKWNKIVASQIGTYSWNDLKGKSYDTICTKMVKSFKDCVKFHLLTIFSQDAVEW